MRFAISEINNGTKVGSLLPNVTLGYRTYDICSLQASTLVTFALLGEQYRQNMGQQTGQDSPAIGVIGPDSSSYTFLSAAALGAYMLPEVSFACSVPLSSICACESSVIGRLLASGWLWPDNRMFVGPYGRTLKPYLCMCLYVKESKRG